MKRLLGVSPTSLILRVALFDSSSTIGAVLTGLTYSSTGLTIAIIKDGASSATVLTKEDITTIGTYQAPSSSAHCRFKAVDATNMTGLYEIHLHNDTIAGASGFIMKISGATNLAPAFLEVETANVAADVVLIEGSDATNQIRDAVVDDATRIDASALNTLSGHDPGETIMGATDLGTGAGLTSLASASDLAVVDGNVDTILSRVIGTLAAGTHNAQSGDAFARLGAPSGASISADIAAHKAVSDGMATQIGTAGDGLTAIPWNAAWDAEVQSEVADALDAALPSSPTAKSINDLVLRAGTALTGKMTINESTGAYSMKQIDDEETEETFGGAKAASGTIISGAGITTRDPA